MAANNNNDDEMKKFVVTVRGTREVLAEIVVEARDEDAAADRAVFLVEHDFYGDIEWMDEGSPEYEDVDDVSFAQDYDQLTKVRKR